jgi:c-di-GMP-binding flagellar brake protein YcgR
MSTSDLASNSSGLALAIPAIHQPFVGDLEPYLVHSPIDILATLRALIAKHVPATIYFNGEANFILTSFLNINPEFEELIFDQGPDKRANEKLLAADALTVVAFLDHIKVQFSVKRPERTHFGGAEAFRVRAPKSILRLQRRTAFRARTQLATSPYLLLSSAADRFGKNNAARLRIADISTTGFAIVAPDGRPVLTAGMRLPNCMLELDAGEAFSVEIEIRHVAIFKDSLGREICRSGCEVLNISAPREMAIQRYVNQIAVAGLGKR